MEYFWQFIRSLEVPYLEEALKLFIDFWNLELFQQGDSVVRVNQVVLALVFVLIGSFLCRRLAAFASRRLASLARISSTGRLLLNRVFYYLFLFIILLIGLSIAGIPITIFTVFGGALAIGFGFGTQNAFNNLISGFILMVERTVRVGDIIEIAGFEARVEDIGNRCVRVRRTDGADVLVPNAMLLEQMVVNWTLFDNQLRGSVTVGIAYGSPTRQMRDILYEAAAAIPQILQEPINLIAAVRILTRRRKAHKVNDLQHL